MRPAEKSTQSKKSDDTRERILESALALFRRVGFEQTTMREIATEADVALGSAYYYFASKEALVMAFYERASREMTERIADRLSEAQGLANRLKAILDVKFDYFAPNRMFLGAIARHAADPEHPLSPFSQETAHIRRRDLDFFAEALAGSRISLPKDLAPYLPNLLWLYQMGLIFFWISDRSPEQTRTWQLRDKSLALLVTALRLAGFPLLRPLRKKIIDLLTTLELEAGNV